MHLHDDWATPAFDLDPAASHTGPFPHRALLHTWWEHCRPAGAELLLAERATLWSRSYRHDGRLEFLGDPALTDYHSPLGTQVPAAVAELAAGVPEGHLSVSTACPRRRLSRRRRPGGGRGPGRTGAARDDGVLDLPDDPSATWRPSTRGSATRCGANGVVSNRSAGSPLLDRVEGSEAVETFVAMHRRAEGEKGRFMSETRAASSPPSITTSAPSSTWCAIPKAGRWPPGSGSRTPPATTSTTPPTSRRRRPPRRASCW